ncbi:MAG: N-acetylglucosamine-6-phosphate deacetylase [Sphingopyxis sp.]
MSQRFALTGARILAGGHWLDGHAVIVDGAMIEGIVPAAALDPAITTHRLNGGALVPGFIDIQVNGGGGVLFNDAPTVAGITAIAAAHRKFGTTAMLPTLISDDLSIVARAIAAVDEAIAQGVPGIIGIHIEGPFLNAAKRGIHDAAKFRVLDADAVALLSSLKRGKTLVTLAPECAPPGMIAALVKRGVIVSAGHTLASYDDMQRAIAEGLSGVTHLFNAMTQMEGRAPGVVGAALESGLFCGIIADGHHVHGAALRVAYRALGAERLMLVTDAMPSVGAPLKPFKLGDTEITLKDGALRAADGTLAGSHLDMAGAVRNATSLLNAIDSDAYKMASDTPTHFLGVANKYGNISDGYRADLIHVNNDLRVQSTWIAGRPA